MENKIIMKKKYEQNVEEKGQCEVWLVRSNTEPNKWYSVFKPEYLGRKQRLISTNMGCTCPGWHFRHKCSHIDLILAVHNSGVKAEDTMTIIEEE